MAPPLNDALPVPAPEIERVLEVARVVAVSALPVTSPVRSPVIPPVMLAPPELTTRPERAVTTPTESILVTSSYVKVPVMLASPITVRSPPIETSLVTVAASIKRLDHRRAVVPRARALSVLGTKSLSNRPLAVIGIRICVT